MKPSVSSSSFPALIRLAVLPALMVSVLSARPASAQAPAGTNAPAAPKPGPTATASSSETAARRDLYMIGYSHLDTEWCWNYPQVIREFLPNTLHQNFDLFKKYPDYTFNWTGANRYRLMKEYYPADWETLKSYVAKGRWVPSGSSLEEGDVCIPSGESIIRQVMYGNRYFRSQFGEKAVSDDYMLPDCFGFPASLPSILAHAGIKGFSTQKLTWGSAVGIPFNVGVWVGPDGQGMPAALNMGSYTSNVRDDLSQSQRWLDRIDQDGAKSGFFADYAFFGTGDRGGAPDENSVKWIETSLHGTGPVHVIAGRADAMFTRISPEQKAKLPRYKGDLLLTEHSSGTASSEAEMKRWNRKNELLADSAEKSSVAASLLGAQLYPMARISDAWWRFLPGQFHDIMAGTALPESYRYAWNDQIIAQNEFSDVVTHSVGGVTRAMDTRPAQGIGISLVVYNPLSISREDVVEAEVALPKGTKYVRVAGPDGKDVPAQVNGDGQSGVKILFLARVPSVGFGVFTVRPAAKPEYSVALRMGKDYVENNRYRVTLNKMGDIGSIYDKIAKKEILAAPMRLAHQYERPVNYPSWNMDWTDQKEPPRGYVDGPATISIVEDGPVRVALKVTRESEGSRFGQIVRLSAGGAGNRVEFVNEIDWRGQAEALKATFPLTVSNPQATYNWGPGTVQRGNNDPKKYEVSSHDWFDLASPDGKYGVAILNEAKYGSDKPDDNTVRLTLLYTPGVRGGYQHQATQDVGRHRILYALQGHAGGWQGAGTQWEAARLNQPLAAFAVPAHAGPLGKTFSLATTSNSQVQIEALKQAEDGKGFVVRLFELGGSPVKNASLKFAAPVTSLQELDGQERPIASTGAASVKGGSVVFDMEGYRPRAFRVTFGKAPVALTAPVSTPIALPFDTSVTRTSTGANPNVKAFDDAGHAIPAEQLPSTLDSGGIQFRLGPAAAGAKNAVAAMGQKIALPAGGTGRKLYVLASTSSQFDTQAAFRFDTGKTEKVFIQSAGGFIGQWDNRVWNGKEPELTYGWDLSMNGLEPGYIKPATVAWYADHGRKDGGANDPYQFVYLFRYALDIPAGAKAVYLPKEARIHILAASLSANPNDTAVPVHPLADTLSDHLDPKRDTPPAANPPGGHFSDATTVMLSEPLYYFKPDDAPSDLRYTLDGSEPLPGSPIYDGKGIFLNKPTTIKVRQIHADVIVSPLATYRFDVNDTTPPKPLSAKVVGENTVRAVFSEPLEKTSAEATGNYSLGGVAVSSAVLGSDSRTVTLTTSAPLPADSIPNLTVNGVKDTSPAGNATTGASLPLSPLKPVFTQTGVVTLNGQKDGPTRRDVVDLPVHARDSWTINLFVNLASDPDELSVIAGIGDAREESGAERFLVKFHGGIHFWGSNVDVTTGKPFDIGKWQMITLTFDGTNLRIYKDSELLKTQEIALSDARPVVRFGPKGPWDEGGRVQGKVAGMSIWSEALPADMIEKLKMGAPK